MDLAKEHGELHFVVGDNVLYEAADKHPNIEAYKTLADFIQIPDVQEEISSQRSADNIKRLAVLLPTVKEKLEEEIGSAIVDALSDRDVEDPRIPDDNNEAVIIGVGEAEELEPDFENVEFYDEDVIGLQFELVTECTLNYAIFKADYYSLDDDKTEGISISERNDHYYDADEDYRVRVKGVLTLKLDGDKLSEEDLDDDALKEIISEADFDIDVEEVSLE